jgi:hypothetical protein
LLVACLGFAGFCWLIAALLDSITAQGVAETPQPFQALGVALVYALAVLPLPVAVVAAVVVNLRRRSWRVALLWGAGWLFGMSLLVAFLAGPKSA